MSIFDDIASGADRLRRGEDALIWSLRAAGMDWHEVGTVLLTRRAERRERCLALLATGRPAIHAARLDRERLRQERARQLFAQKKPPEAVRNITGLPLWRVYGIAGELRRERQTCAA